MKGKEKHLSLLNTRKVVDESCREGPSPPAGHKGPSSVEGRGDLPPPITPVVDDEGTTSGVRRETVSHGGDDRHSGGHRRHRGRPAAEPQDPGCTALLRERRQVPESHREAMRNPRDILGLTG